MTSQREINARGKQPKVGSQPPSTQSQWSPPSAYPPFSYNSDSPGAPHTPALGYSYPTQAPADSGNAYPNPPGPPRATPTEVAKKQSKWSPEEDALIIELRGSGMKWDDISKRVPGRSPISCRLHYQKRRNEWDEGKKKKLALLYER